MKYRGQYPKDWNVSLLDDVTSRASGHTPNKNHPEYWNGGIKWVSLADSSKLDSGLIAHTDKEISRDGLKHSSAVLLPKGTVIISRDAGVGKSAVLAEEMAVSQHFIAWKCDGPNQLHNWYLYNWLRLNKPEFERQAIGSTIKTIGLPFFKKIKIAHPTYEEQRRIAEILSTWDRAIEATEKLIANSEAQKKSLMQQLLTGKKRLPGFDGEWKSARLDVLFNFKKGQGISKQAVCEEGAHSCVLYGELYTRYGEIIDEVASRTNSNDGVPSVSGDLLIPASTTTSGIDLANVTAIGESGVKLGGDINILRMKKPNVCASFFAHYLTHVMKHNIASRAQGITIIHLYAAHLKDLEVQLPRLAEQEKISDVILTAAKEINSQKEKLQKLKSEKCALMQQLLTGKRRVAINKEQAA
ncbi:restriction endonuclease subunit S [Pseudahrensia aquimaris]|uniref:Restriction endonuclease subunit S n=1 Tax=Pseudahrensia aquimaris TaxID=744461 RepID=A0ABW3FIC4_9HYPH